MILIFLCSSSFCFFALRPSRAMYLSIRSMDSSLRTCLCSLPVCASLVLIALIPRPMTPEPGSHFLPVEAASILSRASLCSGGGTRVSGGVRLGLDALRT